MKSKIENNKKNTFKNKYNKNKNIKKEYKDTIESIEYFPRNTQFEFNNISSFDKIAYKSNLKNKKTNNTNTINKKDNLKTLKDIDKDSTNYIDEDTEEFNNDKNNNYLNNEMNDDIIMDKNNNYDIANSSRCLKPKFTVGDLLLASICEIRKDYMIANYTRNKKLFIHRDYSGYSKSKNFKFEDYFKVGQFISAAVISSDKSRSNYSIGKKIKCSIEPHIVNAGLEEDQLIEGMDVWGKLVYSNNRYIPYLGIENFEDKYVDFNANIKKDTNNDNHNDDKDFDLSIDEENEEDEDNESESINDDIYSEAQTSEEEQDNKTNSKLSKSKKAFTFNYILNNNNISYLKTKLNKYCFFKIISIIKDENNNTINCNLDLSDNISQNNKPINLLDKKFYYTKNKPLNFSVLRPGMYVKCINTKKDIVNGIEVKFGDFTGTIFQDHLNNNSNKLNARIIQVSTNSMKVALSNKENIINLNNINVHENLKTINSIYKKDLYNMNIIKKLYGNSLILNITSKDNVENNNNNNNSTIVFIHNTHLIKEIVESNNKLLNNKKNKNQSKKVFQNKSELNNISIEDLPQNVRIKEFNFFDNIAMITSYSEDDENNNNNLNWNDLEIGQKIKTTITKVNPNYIELSVNKYIKGVLYKEHLTDVSINLKSLTNKYKEGNKLTATIFDKNYSTKLLIFTIKPALEVIKNNNSDNLDKKLKEGDKINFVYLGNNLFQHCGGVKGKLMNFNTNKSNFKIGNVYSLNIYKISYNKILLTDKENEVYHPSLSEYDKIFSTSNIMSLISSLNSFNDKNKTDINNINNNNNTNLDEETIVNNTFIGNIVSCKTINPKKLIEKLEGNISKKELEDFQDKYLIVKFSLDNTNNYINSSSNNDNNNNNNNYNEDKLTQCYGFIPVELYTDYYSSFLFKSENINYGKDIEALIVYHNIKNSLYFLSSKNSLITNKDNMFNSVNNDKKLMTPEILYYGYVSKIINEDNNLSVTVSFLGNKKVTIKNLLVNSLDCFYLGKTVIVSRNKNNKLKFESVYKDYTNDQLVKESYELAQNCFDACDSILSISELDLVKLIGISVKAKVKEDAFGKLYRAELNRECMFDSLKELNNKYVNKVSTEIVNMLTSFKCIIETKNSKSRKGSLNSKTSNYKLEKEYYFNIKNIDYIENIICLASKSIKFENTSNTAEAFFNDLKDNDNLNKEVLMEINNYSTQSGIISGSVKTSEADNHLKCIIPVSTYNINIAYILNELNNSYDTHNKFLLGLNKDCYSHLTINKTIAVNIKGYINSTNSLIATFNNNSTISKFINMILSSTNITKSHISNNLTSNDIKKDDYITAMIKGVKGAYIYLSINKSLVGRIHINNYLDDINQLKQLCLTSNPNKIVKGRVIEINNLNNITIYDIIPDDTEKAYISNALNKRKISINYNNNTPNEGVILSINGNSAFPILISHGYGLNIKKINIPFYNLQSNLFTPEISFSSDSVKMSAGESIQFYGFNNKGSICYSLNNNLLDYKKIKEEALLPMKILKKIPGRGLVISLFFDKDNISNNTITGFCDITEITDNCSADPVEYYSVNNILLGRVLYYDNNLNKYFVSFRNSLVNEKNYNLLKLGSTSQAESLLNLNVADLRNKLYKFMPSTILEPNQVAIGYVTSSSEKGVFVKISNNVIARANLKEISDHKAYQPFRLVKSGQLVLLRIISINNKNEDKNNNNKLKINVSLRESVVKYSLTLKLKDINLNNFYMCNVCSTNSNKNKQYANIIGSTFVGEIVDSKENYPIGKILTMQITNINKDTFPPSSISLSSRNVSSESQKLVINILDENIKEKNKVYDKLWDYVDSINNEHKQQLLKKEIKDLDKVVNEEDIDFEDNIKEDSIYNDEDYDKQKDLAELQEDDVELINEIAKDQDNNSEEDYLEDLNEIDDSDEDNNYISNDLKNTIKNSEKNESTKISKKAKDDYSNNSDYDESEEFEDVEKQEEEEFEEDEEEVYEDNNTSYTKAKSSKQRIKDNLKEELEIRKKEKDIIDKEKKSEEDLTCVEDFEKSILLNYNSSKLWIAYAAYILQNINYKAAKQIFERAIKTINITEIKEKLNLWVAYINLEFSYGLKLNNNVDEFAKVLKRAEQINDKKQINKHLILIYNSAKKYDFSYDIYSKLVKEYSNDISIWKAYLNHLYCYEEELNNSENLKDIEIAQPKQIISSALQALISKSKRIELMIYNAGLLYKHNKIEEGKTAFENLVKDNPNRGDIILVYLDKEIAYNNDNARALFMKFIEKDLKLKMLKPIIKKYIEYENKFGDASQRDRAAAYVKNMLSEKTGIKEDHTDEDKSKNNSNINVMDLD